MFITQIVKNQYVKSDGFAYTYGATVSKDVARNVSSKFKRVLHFKSADDWFAYNDKFGAGNLKEVCFMHADRRKKYRYYGYFRYKATTGI